MTRRRTRNPSPLMKREYGMLEHVLPRDELLIILRKQSDERFQRLCDLILSHGSTREKALVTLVLEAGLTYAELATAIIETQRIESVMMASRHTPAIIEDMAIDARSRNDMCTQCGGTGIDKETTGACAKCSGRGTIRVVGDAQSRAKLLDVTGLTSRDRGTVVNVSTPVNVGVPNMAALMGRAERALKPASVDAEVVKEGDA